jgi:hypothetical protein
MSSRLEGKAAIVVGGGQTPGETIGNGRATSILFAREGARVLVVDRDIESAKETKAMINAEGGTAEVHSANVCSEDDCKSISDRCVELYGAIDILHNNVGIGGGDASPTRLTEEAWDQIMDVNLKSVFLTCKYALPVMRTQGSGCITNNFLHSGSVFCRHRRVQDVEGWLERLYPRARNRKCQIRDPRERYHAWPNEYSDGNRRNFFGAKRAARKIDRTTRRDRSARQENGYGLGRRVCGDVSGLG